jgi:YVTN family beta-propeller protein
MTHRPRRFVSLPMALAAASLSGTVLGAEPDRSPIALAMTVDGRRLLVANQSAGSVSWVDPAGGRVLGEVKTGDRPAGVAVSRDGRVGVVAHWFGYDLAILGLSDDRAEVVGRVEVGPEPRGVVIAADGRTAFVAVGASNEVVRVDLPGRKVTGRLAVGREPRGLALAPDGARLVVANARGRSVSVIDVPRFAVERTLPHEGDNPRQLVVSPDGRHAYFAAMKNRGFSTTLNNIDLGWVLGQRIVRVTLDGSEPADAVSLDPMGEAAGDAHGLAIAGGGTLFAVSCGGTHEVMLLREEKSPLPWRVGVGRDVMAADLLKDKDRFRRVALGGRPTELAFAPDGRTLYAANYLENAIQVIDAGSGTLARTIPLGGPEAPSLARRGEALFHDAFRSANHWYSCNTCHSEGHTNGLDFDTLNDGWQDNSSNHLRSRKKVPTLRGVARTGPWTWHGWQDSLDDAVVESFTKSMQGKRPSKGEVEAVTAYLATLDFPRNPHREADGGLSPSARRGEAVFRSGKASCASCHSGTEFTDGKRHDVGLNERGDVYQGHNPPSLRGVHDKDPYLHDGRARTLRDALTSDHAPENLGGAAISAAELDDLIAYLQSL